MKKYSNLMIKRIYKIQNMVSIIEMIILEIHKNVRFVNFRFFEFLKPFLFLFKNILDKLNTFYL